MPEIHIAISKCMDEVGFVSKSRTNDLQKYKYRGIEEIYASVQKVFAKYGIYSVNTILSERSEERTTKNGSHLIYRILHIRHRFYCSADSSYIETETIGEGMDSGDKASNKAMSVAEKYSIIQLLKIPTSEAIDPDAESHEVKPKNELSNSADSVRPTNVSKKENKASSSGQPKASAVYDNSDKAAQTALAKHLEKKEIPAHLWEEIGSELDGKDKAMIDEIISKALSKG